MADAVFDPFFSPTISPEQFDALRRRHGQLGPDDPFFSPMVPSASKSSDFVDLEQVEALGRELKAVPGRLEPVPDDPFADPVFRAALHLLAFQRIVKSVGDVELHEHPSPDDALAQARALVAGWRGSTADGS